MSFMHIVQHEFDSITNDFIDVDEYVRVLSAVV